MAAGRSSLSLVAYSKRTSTEDVTQERSGVIGVSKSANEAGEVDTAQSALLIATPRT